MRLRPFVLLAMAPLFATRVAAGQESPAPAPPVETSPAAPAAQGTAPAPTAALAPAPGAVPPPTVSLERHEYVGMPGPATSAGTTPLAFLVHPGFELFGQYGYTVTYSSNGSSSASNGFEVPRVHASLDGGYGPVRGRFLLEGVQSANDGALIGVGGNSIAIRVREAYAAWAPLKGLEASLGVVPTLTIAELDGSWLLRPITASPLELSSLASPADLGGTLRYTLPAKYGWVAVSATNGEGYTSPELNTGKNTEIAAEVHPLPGGALLPLAAFVSYVGGSSGTDSARADRITAALLWQGRRVRAGVDYTQAWGVGANAEQQSSILEGFLRVEPIDRLILGVRASYWVVDTNPAPTPPSTSAPSDAITTIWGSVGWRIADPLEVHLAITRALPTAFAESSITGSDYLELRAVTRVVF